MKERQILPFGLGTLLLALAAWQGCDDAELPAERPVAAQVESQVELSGVVTDENRTAIPHATVRAGDVVTVADDGGQYTLLVRRGQVPVEASAPGYGTTRRTGAGAVDLVLVPEATLGGTVVDTAGAPVAGLTVTARAIGSEMLAVGDPAPVTTDAHGRFRFAGLAPATYALTTRHAHGFGYYERWVDSGQAIADIVMPLAPAHQVSGRVVIEPNNEACTDGGFMLHDAKHDRDVEVSRNPDGTLRADGVMPGSYTVTAWCDGHLSREHYPSLTVTNDIGGLVWPVTRGLTLRGRVVSQHGSPITDASVTATPEVSGPGYAREQVGANGEYVLRGLRPGRYQIQIARHHTFGTVPAVETAIAVELARDTERELILEDTSGSITGHIVGPDNVVLPAVYLTATPSDPNAWSGRVRADDAGGFQLENIPPGKYRLTVEGHEAKSQSIEVRTGHITATRIVVSER
jgi:protocatechuate 3,4-dioxygenase beta subunit